jgi:cobaltochelatase CobT
MGSWEFWRSVNDRLVKAMAACARTLTGAPDADAVLAQADMATLGGLRAFADRFAVRRRFHDPEVQARHRPSEIAAAALLDALELARLDALGARWLPGIAHNLVAHPGADDDGIRWLAFAMLSGQQPPASKQAALDRVAAALPAPLLSTLRELRHAVADQESFAAAAAAWARDAVAHIPAAAAASTSAPRFELPLRYVDRWERRGRYAAPTTTPRREDSAGEQTGGPTNQRRSSDPGDNGGYRVFTTVHDRVVNASSLATRDELAALRATLEGELNAARTVIARLAKRLLRVLMARQMREWRFDRDEGLLDPARLAAMVASRGAVRPFKEETDSPFPSTVVTLLIDHSGSMRGRPMRMAALTVEIFVRVLERCGVKCEVLGFTTRDWDGGAPGRVWAEGGYREAPGRLNALEHIVIKGADVPWRRARLALGLFMRDDMLKENIDGEALVWAHRRLLARSEQRRILVVVSDGTPMDEATLAANGWDYLDRHLQAVIDDIESRSPVQLAAIGIGHDVSRFYSNATRIARIDDLGPALSEKLMGLLATRQD